MKKIICLVTTLCMLTAVSFAFAEGTMPAQDVGATVTAAGTGHVVIVPDFATIILGVNTQAQTVADAQRQNAALADAVIAALIAQGVAREDMQTSYFGIYPISDYSYTDGIDRVLGYRVENNLSVTIRDLNKVSAVLDSAMAAGANQSYGLTFDSTKRGEAYDQALAMATKEARRKAQILAGAADVTLGELVNATEQSYGYYGENNAGGGMMDMRGDTPIMNGSLTVVASVISTYKVK